MADKYTPLFARVLIQRMVEEKRGSIHIPANIAKRHARSEGTVIAVGPTADENIKVGDHVIFGKHAGTWLDGTYSEFKDARGVIGSKDNNDGTLFICQDEDILVKVEA